MKESKERIEIRVSFTEQAAQFSTLSNSPGFSLIRCKPGNRHAEMGVQNKASIPYEASVAGIISTTLLGEVSSKETR
jgi:hypothetical protein